ncbi:MAG: AMP-binding protein [Acidimicrobiia bacterium]
MAARRGRPGNAVVTAEGAWSNDEYFALASGAADWLDTINAAPGRPVAALISATPYAFALLLGAAATERPLAPLSPRLTVAELSACLDALAPSVIIAEPATEPVARAVSAATGLPIHILTAIEPSTRELDLDPANDRAVCIVHTSGTTGLPKAVVQREGPMGARCDAYAPFLHLTPDDVYVSGSPFHHQGGLGMYVVAIALGAAVVIFPQFSLDAWRALRPLRPTHIQLVPTMVRDLLDAGELAIPSLRYIVYGAARMPVDTVRRAMAAAPGVSFVQGFSQSEGGPIAVLSAEDHRLALAGHPELLDSVGQPVPNTEIHIHEPGADGVGEIWARCEHSFVRDADGWQHYGDLGRLENGYLYVAGRGGDVINRGGEKIYPQEVEEVVARHPGVREVSIAGIPDERLGAVPYGYVVPVDPVAPPDVDDLRAFARQTLAGYKVPVRWIFVAELPKNAAGKVLRHRLAELAR